MKKTIKKTIGMLLALTIITTTILPNIALANAMGESINDNINIRETPHTKEFITNELYNLGFTDKEIEDLFEEFPYDENQPLLELSDIKSNEMKIDFTNNTPITLANRPGQEKKVTYNISTSFVKGLGYSINVARAGLDLSPAAWAKIIVKKIGWKITVLVGAISALVAGMFMGKTGVKINVTYVWAYGDNSMVWYWAPIKYSAYKY